MGVITVMTFNLLSPSHADWPRRRDVIWTGLRDLNPDIVALQECVRTSDYDQAADLPFAHVEGDAGDRRHAAEADDDVLDFEQGHAVPAQREPPRRGAGTTMDGDRASGPWGRSMQPP